jgi:hypothetical protein
MAVFATVVATGAPSWSQISPPLKPSPPAGANPLATPTPPPTVPGYVMTVEVTATAPDLKTAPTAPADAQALAEKLRNPANLKSRLWLTLDMSRQEILSPDFILPEGTLIIHKAGERSYFILDPKAKTYVAMDADALINALEGGVGIVNRQYEAKVEHTAEKKTVAGLQCRQSKIYVSYVSSIPVENDKVLVQQKNLVDVCHTSQLVSSAAMDHFFFKYQRDTTGAVQRAIGADIGFPLEVNTVVTQGATNNPKAKAARPGSLKMVVTEVKQDKALDVALFRIPPAGYRKLDRAPYFAPGAQAAPPSGP